ncbi:MAG: imidazole glycerol phosphate synthase subunit HisH [Chitinophagales bacterium]|nr:imidazole glycerol phosphate synthase subunit HisH [Chitinophagales bacterium]
MIAILDYGVGNVKSISNMFKKIGVESVITADTEVLKSASKYILPGVGAFDYGMTRLNQSGAIPTLENEVLANKKPILGICLGMQLLTLRSDEGIEKGLGWVDAETLKFKLDTSQYAIPHMGWNEIVPKSDQKLFNGLYEEARFYFVHSYYVSCKNQTDIAASCNYGGDFTCSVHRENIYGVQFHPEKSHKFGMQLLKNFSEL